VSSAEPRGSAGEGHARDERPIDALFLSPHLDDAVLSCGGHIHRRTAAGERVVVVTVFAGAPEGGPTMLAVELHALWGLPADPREALAARVGEDDAALAALGAEPERWGLLDAVYRGRATASGLTEASYPTLRSLFAQPGNDPDELGLSRTITELLRALPAARWVFVPLGVGRHVDHALVRRASELAFPDDDRLRYYEELPYARRWLAVRRALRRGVPPGRKWTHETVRLSTADLDAKCRAIACYASQLGPVFRDEADLRRQVKKALRRGGERLWRSRPAR
jgi:LmbE family N-acetylglucosaminyl deacetylase